MAAPVSHRKLKRYLAIVEPPKISLRVNIAPVGEFPDIVSALSLTAI